MTEPRHDYTPDVAAKDSPTGAESTLTSDTPDPLHPMDGFYIAQARQLVADINRLDYDDMIGAYRLLGRTLGIVPALLDAAERNRGAR